MSDMMSMLGGGGGAPAPAPEAPQGGGEEAALPEIQDVLNTIQELLAATQDPDEQAALSKAESALTALVLALQKQEDAAMGTTPAHKFVARQVAAQGGGDSAGGGEY